MWGKIVIINNPHLVTKLEIWTPRYSDAHKDSGERVALLAQYKVQHATPIFIVIFTKAKHLEGQRFAISRAKAASYPIDSNGKIPCYAVPLSAFEPWETGAEVAEIAESLFSE